MKTLKRLIIITAALVSLLILVAAIGIHFIDLNPYQDKINQYLSQATGRSSKISNLKLSLLPTPQVVVNKVAISNPANFSSQDFIKIDSATATLSLSKLLHGKFSLSKLVLKGASINLLVKSNGQNNWQFKPIKNPVTANNPNNTASLNKARKQTHNTNQIKSLFERVLLSNAQISYIDEQNKQSIHLTKTQINLTQLKQDYQYSFDGASQIDYQSPERRIKANLATNAKIDLAKFFTNESTLSDIGLSGKINSQSFEFNHFKIDSVIAHFSSNKNAINISPIKASLYQGQSNTQISFNKLNQTVTIDEKLQQVNMKQLLSDIAGIDLIEGKINLKLHATSQGLSTEKVKQNLTAKAGFTIENGQIHYLNIDKLVQQSVSLIKQLKHNPLSQVMNYFKQDESNKNSQTLLSMKKTSFNILTGDITLKDNKLLLDKLVMNSKHYHIEGQGIIHLSNNKLDYQLQVTDLTPSKTIKQAQTLLGGSFPIRITGNLTRPKATPDVFEISKNLSKSLLSSSVNELSESSKQISKQFKNLLSF